MSDLLRQLEVLCYRFLGESAWRQQTPRDICNALLAKAFVEHWDPSSRESYFLIRAHAVLSSPSDQGNT